MAAAMLASAVLRVLWKCPRNPTPGARSAAPSNRAATWVGTPTPMVSASASSSGSVPASSATIPSTRSASTRPSYGQPHTADTVTAVLIPAARAASLMLRHRCSDSSTVACWLACEKVSVATTTPQTSSTPASTARSTPRWLRTTAL